jgi:C-terminal processing protease CtpA/Prc
VFGREQSVGMAVASGFGLKVAAYPKDVGLYNANSKREAQVREIREQIGKLKREYSRRGLTDEEFEAGLQYQLEKLERVNQEYLEKLD